ncbi:MAG: hypothetical protein ACR2JC_09640 [Chloroflexota bacterium]
MEIDAYLDQLSRDGRFNGSVLVRQHGTTLVDRGFGMANRDDARSNGSETAFLDRVHQQAVHGGGDPAIAGAKSAFRA